MFLWHNMSVYKSHFVNCTKEENDCTGSSFALARTFVILNMETIRQQLTCTTSNGFCVTALSIDFMNKLRRRFKNNNTATFYDRTNELKERYWIGKELTCVTCTYPVDRWLSKKEGRGCERRTRGVLTFRRPDRHLHRSLRSLPRGTRHNVDISECGSNNIEESIVTFVNRVVTCPPTPDWKVPRPIWLLAHCYHWLSIIVLECAFLKLWTNMHIQSSYVWVCDVLMLFCFSGFTFLFRLNICNVLVYSAFACSACCLFLQEMILLL